MPDNKQTPGKHLRNDRDVHDSAGDADRLQPDETNINLPEVKDIPGQEHVRPPSLGELADTTASSDVEEGKGVPDDLNENTRGNVNGGSNSTEGIP